jgi:hypothetical protein
MGEPLALGGVQEILTFGPLISVNGAKGALGF